MKKSNKYLLIGYIVVIIIILISTIAIRISLDKQYMTSSIQNIINLNI